MFASCHVYASDLHSRRPQVRKPCSQLALDFCPPGVPYDLTPEFLEELFTKHKIDYVVHGDDPCLLPDGTDAYAHAKKQGRFRMVSLLPTKAFSAWVRFNA